MTYNKALNKCYNSPEKVIMSSKLRQKMMKCYPSKLLECTPSEDGNGGTTINAVIYNNGIKCVIIYDYDGDYYSHFEDEDKSAKDWTEIRTNNLLF